MKKPQWLLIISSIVCLLALFFLGDTIPPAKKNVQKNSAKSNSSQKITFAEIESRSKQGLDSTKTKALQALQGKTDTASLRQLSSLWASAKQANMSAKYKADLAKLENTEKSLTFASQYFIDLYNIEQDTATKQWQASQAIELLEKVLAINPNNLDAKAALGSCYTDGTGETMKGVTILKEVAEKNPSNIPAAITLGRLAIQSGQWEKAIARLEKLLITHPKNTEALYFLAEAYKGSGNINKAKELFNKCKQLVKNPNFSKEIDDYIKTF